MAINRRHRILILSEGFEEKAYIDKILSFPHIRKDIYEFVPSINVKSNSQLFARFQSEYMRGYYDVILIFCDGDKCSCNFKSIKDDINNKIFGGINVAESILIFVNPVTLQVVLSHIGQVSLTHIGKKGNAPIVERMTGIKNYDAHQDQIDELIKNVKHSNYHVMKENMKLISTNVDEVPSSNILQFLNWFENDDTSWIDEIQKLMNRKEGS